MMADVPMCLIIRSTKSSCFRRNSTIYKQKQACYSEKEKLFPDDKSSKLTCSGLRPIRIDRTLEKKLARSGLSGGSF